MSTFQLVDLLSQVRTQALHVNTLNYDEKQPNVKIIGKYQSFTIYSKYKEWIFHF